MNTYVAVPGTRLCIVQVVETMTMGGAENLAVNMANGLAARGCDSHLVVVTEPGVLSDRVDPSVQVHYLGFERSSIRQPLAFAWSLYDGRRRLKSLLESIGTDVAQTHLPGANFLGLLLTFGTDVHIVPTVHNNREFHYGDTDSSLLFLLRKRAYRAMVTRCSGMVAVSAAVKTSLEAELGTSRAESERIHVVTNGVRVRGALGDLERREIRARYGLKDEDIFVMGAGRLSNQKNFTDLIRVASLVCERNDEVCFVIAGEGPLRNDLELAIEAEGLGKRVLLAGNVIDLERVMRAADIFVTTSLWEGLPLVLLEAMACGLSPVGYAIDGVNEILSDGIQGRVVSVGDIQTMADALEILLKQPELRARYGSASKVLVESSYNFETLLDRLLEVYRTVVSAGD